MNITNCGIKDALGNQAMVPGPDKKPVDLKLFDALRTILWTMPSTDLTLGDSMIARDVLQGMAKASQNGNIYKPEDAHYDWLKKIVKDHATRVFGINAICVVEELK